ncbi:uncharacterized protein LOC134449721 [Engraulis encrasicolus]|uniref:uncharacterized protein LOC134449721 n=1 Tax=Engraulis encrasicolus TaxID=184585 RepID=UPI002FD1CCE8
MATERKTMVAMKSVAVVLSACVLLLIPVIPEVSSSSSSSSLDTHGVPVRRFVRPRLLRTIRELTATGFGQPHPPHHGYVLLRWYVQCCVDNNYRSTTRCKPTEGKYGFHLFNNRDPLLPRLTTHKDCKYYTLGNLNSYYHEHADDLPYDVRRYYDRFDRSTNMDRLLVKYCPNQNLIEDIYVSEHYNRFCTYQIGSSLISVLRGHAYRVVEDCI